MTHSIQVLIIGAGQAGLAVANALKNLGIDSLVVDRNMRVGDSWRHRYRSLTLFTPRSLSALDDLSLSGDPEGYATGLEFADYLDRYAGERNINVRLATTVCDLSVKTTCGFVATLDADEKLHANAVIVAAGAFQRPVFPAMGRNFSGAIGQLTVASYQAPADVPPGAVLVVGDGASGRDIAADLAGSHEVTLACGRPRRLLPERILGIATWRWLRTLGLMGASADSPIGKFMRRADPFPNRQRGLDHLRGLGIDIRSRLTAIAGDVASFSDGTNLKPTTIVWCLGYRDDLGWLTIPGALGAEGQPLHKEGQSPIPGLWYVGRPWQRNRASGLVMGVSVDAAIIARQTANWLRQFT